MNSCNLGEYKIRHYKRELASIDALPSMKGAVRFHCRKGSMGTARRAPMCVWFLNQVSRVAGPKLKMTAVVHLRQQGTNYSLVSIAYARSPSYVPVTVGRWFPCHRACGDDSHYTPCSKIFAIIWFPSALAGVLTRTIEDCGF